MLTESEKKWLETRLQNLKVSGWFSCTEGKLIPLVNFHHKHLHSDWKAAAEFEACVVARLARGVTYGELPCGADPDCPDEHMGKYSTKETPMVGCYMCVLRAARLAVESEMEKEGK